MKLNIMVKTRITKAIVLILFLIPSATFACGACGETMVYLTFPYYRIWAAILPLWLIAAFIMHMLTGGVKGLSAGKVVGQIAGLLFLVFAGSLGGLFIWLVINYIASCVKWIRKRRHKELAKKVKHLAVLNSVTLVLLLSTGIYSQVKFLSYDDAELISRVQSGTGPARSLAKRIAKRNSIPRERLLEMLRSENPNARNNAADVIRLLKDPSYLEQVMEIVKDYSDEKFKNTFYVEFYLWSIRPEGGMGIESGDRVAWLKWWEEYNTTQYDVPTTPAITEK